MKIYGTLGPACSDTATLERMLRAGLSGMRLNLSHVSIVEAEPMITALHKAAEGCGVKAELLMDMQGPELRIGALERDMLLSEGGRLLLGEGGVPVPEAVLPYLDEGQELLLDDGKICCRVEKKLPDGAEALVLRGGVLRGRKSICLTGLSITGPVLTPMDMENIRNAPQYGVTALMQPFVRGREELEAVRRALDANGGRHIRILAKIESMEGVENIESLIGACDEIIIARGDLGNAVSLCRLPAVQKRLAAACRRAGRDFTVVTQLLASMEHSPVPTRAEVSDIFNAVLDGAASLMLTGETAVGAHPAEAVELLVAVAEEAMKYMAAENGAVRG